jgi:Transposase
VCVSGKVFDELEGKLPLPFEDRGEQRLKNIARPIRVYALKGGDVSPREPQAARPSQKVADRPSIAVLPFTNLSGDPEQEYLVAKTRREFTPEFKQETVALWEGSGRPQVEIAAELGVQPSQLRRCLCG